MQTDIKQYTPLRTITAYALDEKDKSIGSEDKCWLLGLRALTKLNQQFAAQPKTVEIILEDNLTAKFPPDCISWAKIGIVNDNGELSALKINTAITNYRDLNYNRLADLQPQVQDGLGNFPIIPFYNYYYSGDCFQLFGYRNGLVTYGDCTVDDLARVIIFPPNFQYSSVLFEYISAPERDVDYQVPTVLQEAIIAFIKWKLNLGSSQEFYAEAIEARRSMPKKKFVLQAFNQVIRESQAMKLKA